MSVIKSKERQTGSVSNTLLKGLEHFFEYGIFHSCPPKGSLSYYLKSWMTGKIGDEEYNEGRYILEGVVKFCREYINTNKAKYEKIIPLYVALLCKYLEIKDYQHRSEEAMEILFDIEELRIEILSSNSILPEFSKY